MKLLPKSVLETMPKLYAQETADDPIAYVKYFTPWSNWTWYGFEYDEHDNVFFGLVQGHEEELGYFSLKELPAIKGPAGLKVERDIHFAPSPMSELRKR